MEAALIELIKQGAPLARTAIICYYVYWSISALLFFAGVMIPSCMGYHLIKRWQDHEMGLYKR